MARGTSYALLALALAAGLLTGCNFSLDSRDPWRVEAEEKCIAEKGVIPSAFMEPMPAISGAGACGIEHPFRVSAFAQGNVVLEPAGRLACPVIRETDLWVQDVVQPASLAWFGQPVVAISQMSAYSCRGMNGNPNAKISEHAFGNALDVGAFRLADGRWITVKNGWKGTPEERGFLLQVQAGACERFTTVLAPGSNVFHYDHIHVDLMRHEKGRTICKPAPRPMPAPLIAKAPMSPPAAAAPQPEPAVYAPPPAAAPPQEERPSFLSTLFGPRPAQARQEEPPPPPMPTRMPAPDPIVASPAPPPPATYAAPLPPAAMPPAAMPAPASASRAPAPQQRAPGPQGLPPGWQVGPQGVPVSQASSANPETGSIKRKYYSAPVPQASTLPLPKAKPGED